MSKELRLIELFSGIGSQTQALKNIGVPHKVVAVSDICPFADKSYRALHGNSVNNLGDIQKIAGLPKADLWTYSFPCQDLSVASQTKLGLRGARSGLLYEVERLLIIAKNQGRLPRYLLLENVKNLIGKNHRADYEKWLAFLVSLGYKNFWQVINAKDYLPQNRERVFCVSILGDKASYEFPVPPVRTAKLKDFLDNSVDERYYIKLGVFKTILNTGFSYNRRRIQVKDFCRALIARDFYGPVCLITGKLETAVLDMLLRLTDTSKGGIPLSELKDPVIVAQRGRNPDSPGSRIAGLPTEQRFEPNLKGVCNTLTTVQKDNFVCVINTDKDIMTLEDIFDGLRIRKLTEREYWRLMGWSDRQIGKVIKAGVSKKHMYKQAGNGICVPVLEAIFRKLFL